MASRSSGALRSASRGGRQHPARVLIGAFAAVIAVGTALLCLPLMRAEGQENSFTDAFFTATSAVTVTGLNVVPTGTAWTTWGQIVIMILIQVGGLGTMTLGTLVVLLVFKRLGLRTRLMALAEGGSLSSGNVRRVAMGVATVAVIIEVIVAVILSLRLWLAYDMPLGQAAWYGLFHSVSAFNNAGFSLWPDSLTQFGQDPFMLLPIVTAVFVGSIGFPVIFELSKRWRRPRRWSLHTKLTLTGSIFLVALGGVLLTAFEWANPATLGADNIGSKILNGFFMSINTRSGGFNTIEYAQATGSSILTTDILMIIGGGSVSTAGGLKVTTVFIMLLAVVAEARGRTDLIAFSRRISDGVVRQAVSVAMLFSAAVIVATILMLNLTDASLDQTSFEVISALGTVGLSLGITPTLDQPAQLVICLLMFVGRLGPIAVASALALRSRQARYRLPESRPLVG